MADNPKPLPRTILEGSPKLTILKTLKNSRETGGCRVHHFPVSNGRIFDQRNVVLVKTGPAKCVAAQRTEAAEIGPVPPGTLIGMKKNELLFEPRPK